jgi:hypothetical protein
VIEVTEFELPPVGRVQHAICGRALKSVSRRPLPHSVSEQSTRARNEASPVVQSASLEPCPTAFAVDDSHSSLQLRAYSTHSYQAATGSMS